MVILPLMLPDTTEKKAQFFAKIGSYLYEKAMQPTEALFLSESWYVAVQEAPAVLEFPPSKHPARQEAIIAIGRSADNRQYTQVLQPFTKDKDNRLVWQATPIAVYDEKRTPDNGSAGLLDYLFARLCTLL